jgi:hypothetical protein
MAMGRVSDGAQAREIVRRSFKPNTYEPGSAAAAWQDAAGRLKALLPSN